MTLNTKLEAVLALVVMFKLTKFIFSGPYLDGQVLGAGLEFDGKKVLNPGFDPEGQKVKSLTVKSLLGLDLDGQFLDPVLALRT